VKLLLDTHVILRWLEGSALSEEASAAIAAPENLVAISAASIWEASIKASLGKLRLPGSLSDHAIDCGFEPLAISLPHAERAGGLPPHHRDPFDRMLVAQAMSEGMTLVTRDPAFVPYDVDLILA
jgi:PIN domain nuclease of toxin-antitoxin system